MVGNDQPKTELMATVNLARHYTMGESVVRAVDGVSISITRGEFIMVVGSSGSGKSTLMHLLGCMENPSGGEYRIGGEVVSGLDDSPLSVIRNRTVGFVFQRFNLLNSLSVIENIALPLVYSGKSREERLEIAKKHAVEVGLAQRLDHRPTQLSGGEAQRVAIARALVNDPDILLADEPTGNLDSGTGREIMDIFHDLNRNHGYTILMVTHDTKYAEEGTRKITMRDGVIVEDIATGNRDASGPAGKRAERHVEGTGKMSFIDLLRMGVTEGLLTHKMRTALTMLGIIIAVAGVIAMSSFSLGSKKKQADQVRKLGANLIRITDNQLEGEKLSRVRMRGSRGLRLTDIELLRKVVPGVERTAGVREIKLNIAGESVDLDPRIIGVSGDYLPVNGLRIAEGRFIDEYDRRHCARVAVVGHSIGKKLGTNVVGRMLMLGGTPYSIVGVLANRQVDLKGLEATGIRDPNYDLILPLETLLMRTKYLDMRSELDEIHLQLETEDLLYESGTSARRALAMEHGGEEDFKLIIPLDLLKQKQQAQRILDILTICVSSIALVVGGIGIMNIMLASVTERIREIGIRRVAGATRLDIKKQFLSESVMISIVGGLSGIVLALVVVGITCSVLDLPVVVSFPMVLVAFGAAVLTGLGFGMYPAMQAAEKDPVEALRYE